MSNEEDFTGKFLMNFDRLTQFFRTEEVSVEVDLKTGGLLIDITKREKPLRLLQNLAATHYKDKNIDIGFTILIKQVADLRTQIETQSKKVSFNSTEFDKGYRLVKERLLQIINKK